MLNQLQKKKKEKEFILYVHQILVLPFNFLYICYCNNTACGYHTSES